MSIEVVLISDDPKLGRRGQVVKVSPGYAQNYLFPNHKAQPATPANLKPFEAEKARQAKTQFERIAQAKALADRLRASTVRLEMACGEGDKLFGAVTAQHIVDALAKDGLACERKMLHLEEPIKKLGRHEVEMRLHPEVTVTLQVEVVKK